MNRSSAIRNFTAGLSLTLTAWAGGEFDLRVVQERMLEGGTINTCILRMDGKRYLFLPPAKWTATTDETGKKINVQSPDNVVITVEPSKPASSSTGTARETAVREQLLLRYPGARVVEESACYAEGGAGRAYDLEWSATDGSKCMIRFAIVTIGDRTFELVLTTKPEQFQADGVAFAAFLNTFQLAPAETP